MKVRAKHNINLNGAWHRGGEVFDIDDHEYADVANYVTTEAFVSDIFPPDGEPEQPKRTRRKKSDTETE